MLFVNIVSSHQSHMMFKMSTFPIDCTIGVLNLCILQLMQLSLYTECFHCLHNVYRGIVQARLRVKPEFIARQT